MDVCKGGGVCQMWTNADRGRGGSKKGSFCADILYGRPLCVSDVINFDYNFACFIEFEIKYRYFDPPWKIVQFLY